MMFDDLIGKITGAEIISEPFDHIRIDNFLGPGEIQLLQSDSSLKSEAAADLDALLLALFAEGGEVYRRAGCAADVAAYLDVLKGKSQDFSSAARQPANAKIMTSIGLGVRMPTDEQPILSRLFDTLHSPEFETALRDKLDFHEDFSHNVAGYKFLSGYQIPPHPDSREKGLTYLLNLTPAEFCRPGLGTKLHNLKPEFSGVPKYWEMHPETNRCWVPWDWVEFAVEYHKSNTFYAFKPDYNTLHSVNLNYNHLAFQRVSVIGNLWRTDYPAYKDGNYEEIERWIEERG